MQNNSKADKRQCLSKCRPLVTSCRGGLRMVLSGKNSRGSAAQVTVFLDNAFLPGLVGDIARVVDGKAEEAINLRERVKAAANGKHGN